MAASYKDDLTGEELRDGFISLTARYHHKGRFYWYSEEPVIFKNPENAKRWLAEKEADLIETITGVARV